MAGYHLEQEALSIAVRGLDQGAGSLRDGLSALRNTDPRELGTDRLTAIVIDLVHRSTGDLAGVAAELADASAGARRCLAGYDEAEHHVRDLLLGDGPSDFEVP
jgi:hypothetical protein